MDTTLDPMMNAAFLLFAFVSPVLVAVCKQSGFTKQVNALIALAVYAAVGIGAVVLSGKPVNNETLVSHVMVAMVIGRAAYSMFWDQLGKADDTGVSLDERLTRATSLVKEA